MKKYKLFILLFLAFVTFLSANEIGDDCGTWRWDVKTGTDDEGESILSKKPIRTTIDELTKLERPESVGKKDPRFPEEKRLVKVRGFIIEHKIVGGKGDTDYHIVVKSSTKKSQLIAEIPNPECGVFSDSPELKELFEETRESYEEQIGVPSSKLKPLSKPVEVEIVGIPLWDMPDHGGGCSPNGIEIHPVISITRLDGAEPATPTSGILAESDQNFTQRSGAKTPLEILTIILLGALLGITGQGVRIAIGLKKLNDASETKEHYDSQFDSKKLIVSILYGVIVGMVGGVFMAVDSLDKVWDKSIVLAIIAAGYAGADFIEGFISKKLPSLKENKRPGGNQSASSTVAAPVSTGTPPEGEIPQS